MSGRQTRAVDIEIHQVAYAPVGGVSEGEIRTQSALESPISMPSVFNDYIEETVIKGDITSVSHGIFPEHSSINEQLETLLKTGSDEEYLSNTVALAEQLNEQMPGAATDGLLFVSTVTLESGNISGESEKVVSLLKLDAEDGRRLVRSDEGFDEVANAFPRRDQLQKGAVYPAGNIPPHTRAGDIKIYQNSNSDYFRAFFDLRSVVPSSLEQSRVVLNACNSIIQDSLGRRLRSEDVAEIISSADEDEGQVTIENISSSLHRISDGVIDEENISKFFEQENLRHLQIDTDQFPEVFKYTVDTSGGTVRIKFPIAANPYVEIEDEVDSSDVQISGYNISADYVDR